VSGGPIVVHPGAAAGSRRWPAERWAAVAGDLAGEGRRVVLTGGPGEEATCQSVALADEAITDLGGQLELRELAWLIGRARLLLSGDTGVAHVATAHGTPSVVLFGPTSPGLWGPRIDEDLHRVLWRPRPDDPPGDPHARTTDVRLARIPVEAVLAEARIMLAGSADEALGR
jgi:ADP-heptose:LPS heptosyltransferase